MSMLGERLLLDSNRKWNRTDKLKRERIRNDLFIGRESFEETRSGRYAPPIQPE